MGKIVRMPCARVAPAEMGMAPASKPTSFFSEGLGGFMKWTYSTDLKGYRKVMIGGVQLDCEGCPKKVRYAIELTDGAYTPSDRSPSFFDENPFVYFSDLGGVSGVKLVRTDMENEIVYVMGKNMKMEQLKKNIRMESKSAEILDILPWKIKY
ncbi:hypothetical protein AXF42_Ash018743 [Apostasia shenzhenica]|uniref:Uncharacterized protein n=1 Tax=Apostasia shenzhenica TaxID=1088818 RepID=A0A2I0AK53_9ASPA|nr:hypothetical protein AXF42_Ash018743 [Apostasia shenzhenica]